MDPYRFLFANILYPAWESGLRHRPTLRYLAYLEKTQWLPLADLQALQVKGLARLLQHAYLNVPHYRRQFDRAGLRPEDIRTLSDLARLPILSRQEASASVAERTATAGPRVEIRKQTSGSTGRPLVFGYERDSEHWRHAVRMRGYRWAGMRLGQRALHFWGEAPRTNPPTLATRLRLAKRNFDRALRRELYIDCGRRGPGQLAAVVETIKRGKPEVMVCYAQAAADLARYVVERKLRDWDTIPVICGAERVLPNDRAFMEKAFGPAVFETYGCREVMLMATECVAHQGLHTSMETLVVEVVVRDAHGQARAAKPGEIGEVVITDLTNLAMPFIRYANGDMAVVADPGDCPCGRAHPRLQSIEGRVADTLMDASGSRVNGLVFNVVIAFLADAIREFQVVQHRDLSITLRIVPTPQYGGQTEQTLRRTWEKYLPGVPVTIELVAEIPIAASGKKRVVVVER